MKGLDTNILVRYLVRDDAGQAAAADRAIGECVTAGEKMLIQPLVLCELVWVLETAYGFNKPDIVPILERILRTSQFEVAQREIVWQALTEYRSGKGDFSDYFIGGANTTAGATGTLTFDKALRNSSRFIVLKQA